MSKINENYFVMDKNHTDYNNIESILSNDEQILWRGKPKKSAFIFGKVMAMLPIALIWLLFDGGFITMMLSNGAQIPTSMIIGLIIFFAFHLLPVWIWISNIVTANKQHKKLEYAFTNKRIIIKSGIIGLDFKNIYYAEINSVNLKVGLVDKLYNVGDIYVKSQSGANILYDIENPYFITQKLQEIVVDLKMDAVFPNDLRPKTNNGYKTKYTKNLDE